MTVTQPGILKGVGGGGWRTAPVAGGICGSGGKAATGGNGVWGGNPVLGN